MATATARTVTPEPVIEGYTLELTVEEAEALYSVSGDFICDGALSGIYTALRRLGVANKQDVVLWDGKNRTGTLDLAPTTDRYKKVTS